MREEGREGRREGGREGGRERGSDYVIPHQILDKAHGDHFQP